MAEPGQPRLAEDLRRQFDRIDETLADLGRASRPLHGRLQAEPRVVRGQYREIRHVQDQLVEGSLVLELDVRRPVAGFIAR